MEFVQGKKDGIKRSCVAMKYPEIPKKKFGVDALNVGYAICQIELTPGQLVIQLVNTSKIEHEKST